MPNWTLTKIMSYATQGLGNRSDIAQSDASFWANEAQRQVWDSMPHDLQEALAVSNTAVNENKVTLPTDFEELLSLSDTSQDPPNLLDVINLDQAEHWSTDTGRPLYYQLYNNWLELFPTPDSAYSIQLRYRKAMSDMTLGTAVPSVATRYHYAVFLKTKELLAENVVHDMEAMALNRNAYVSYMNSQTPDRAKRLREQHTAGLALPRRRGQKTGGSGYSFDRSDT